MFKIGVFAIAGILISVVSAAVDPELPSPAPIVNGVFPHGLQRGTTAIVKLSGQNLHDAQSVDFSGKGVHGEILSSLGTRVQLRITADPDAEVGVRDIRLTTSRGVYTGVLDIGALPELAETENNDDWRKPQPIALPVLVNGVIGSEDWDHFGFHARPGQTAVFDISATRHGSRLDADLALLDGKGNELAWVDDSTIFGDPHLEYTFDKEGDCVIRVGSLAGNPNVDYRLSVGELPYVSRAFPAGLSAGAATMVELTGPHMDLVDEVWVGDRLAKGEIMKREPRRLEVLVDLTRAVAPGTYQIHASVKGREVAMPTEIRVSALPELTVRTPGLTLQSAMPVVPSTVVNGVITQPGKSHFYRFDAKAGEHYVFRAESMKLGYHLDPTITVLDKEGKKVAFADDPGMDERTDEFQLDPDLSFTAPVSGTWFLAIRDGMYRGGEQMLYRLTLQRSDADFSVELRDALKSVYAGASDTLQVRVRRRASWDAPIEVWAEGLPGGISAEHQIAPPKDSVVKDTCGVDRVVDGTIVLLPLHADTAAPGHFNFKVKARGVMAGVVTEHEASVWYGHLAAGYFYGPARMQAAELTVAPAPEILLSAGESWQVRPGKEDTVKVTIRRFGNAKGSGLTVRARKLPSGISMESVQLPPEAKEARVTVKTGVGAASGTAILEALAPNGKQLGESAPFSVEIKSETLPGR